MTDTNPNEPTDTPDTPDDPNRPIPLEPREGGRVRPAQSGPRKAEIDSPGLLEDFAEDADFDADPELDRVVQGIPVGDSGAVPTAKVTTDATPVGEPISGQASWRLPAAIGAFVTLTAAIFAGVYAEPDQRIWAIVLITVYWAALHTATGVGAIVVTGLLLGRPIGHFEGAAARMFMVVALFLVVFRLDIPIPLHFEESILATAAYFGGLVVAFRLAPRDAVVVGHTSVWCSW
jgi:hypothetical protein